MQKKIHKEKPPQVNVPNLFQEIREKNMSFWDHVRDHVKKEQDALLSEIGHVENRKEQLEKKWAALEDIRMFYKRGLEI